MGDTFTLFSQPLLNGGVLTIVPPAGVTFTNKLAVDGSIAVLSAGSGQPPALLYTNTGSALQFSWTGTYRLQAQTNSLATGISTNWGDYPGGGASPVTVPLNTSAGSVFFRLKE